MARRVVDIGLHYLVKNELATEANETEPSMTEYDIANRTITKATEQNRIDPNKRDRIRPNYVI